MTAARTLQALGVNTGILMALDGAALFRGEFGEQNAVCVGSALIGRIPVKAGSGLAKVGVLEASLEELNWLDKGTKIGAGKGVGKLPGRRAEGADAVGRGQRRNVKNDSAGSHGTVSFPNRSMKRGPVFIVLYYSRKIAIRQA